MSGKISNAFICLAMERVGGVVVCGGDLNSHDFLGRGLCGWGWECM